MKHCECGNETRDPKGVCAICRLKLKIPAPPEPLPKPPKHPTCLTCKKRFVDNEKLQIHINKNHPKIQAAAGQAVKDTPLLDELEKGHWPSFVKEVKKDKEVDMAKAKKWSDRKCKQEGCEKYPVKKGMCIRHWKESQGLPVGRKKKASKSPEPPPAIPQAKKANPYLNKLLEASELLDSQTGLAIDENRIETNSIFHIRQILGDVLRASV